MEPGAQPQPLDPTVRFRDRAEDYKRFRPDYPAAAVDATLAGLGPPETLRVADLGAGTGISARLLAERGPRVVAVEPNAAMRAQAAPHPRVDFRDAGAEATGLPPGALDLVCAFQAFHWFRQSEALPEISRILTPGGRLAVVWNTRDKEDAFTREYSRVVQGRAPDHPVERRAESLESLRCSPLFLDLRRQVFPHLQELDCEGLLGRARSASYMPKEGPRYEALAAELRALFTRFAGPDGRTRLVYATEVHMAESSGAGGARV
jgi:SAM-dependent methyltransferase